jgi:hypothetical protein
LRDDAPSRKQVGVEHPTTTTVAATVHGFNVAMV